MSDTKSFKARAKRISLISLAVLVGLAYVYWLTVGRAMHEKFSLSTGELLTVAIGVWGDAESLTWDRQPVPDHLKDLTCSRYSLSKDAVSHDVGYSHCIWPSSWTWGPGCGWWRFDVCDIYAVDDFILTQPQVLGRMLHALREPCAYLPTMEQVNRVIEQRGRSSAGNFGSLAKLYACGAGGKMPRHKVILNVLNDNGDVIAQYIQNPPGD